MAGTLDDALAQIVALGQVTDAYTTGSAANVALRSSVDGLASTLGDGQARSAAALVANTLSSPAAVLSAVDAAGYLAGSTAALAWLTNMQTVLNRP